MRSLAFVLVFLLHMCSLFMPSRAFAPPSFFGPQRQSTPRSYSRWTFSAEGISSEGSVGGGGGGGGGDSFSIADLHRELNRRKAEEAMASQAAASPPMGDGEAFMEEQMVSARMATVVGVRLTAAAFAP